MLVSLFRVRAPRNWADFCTGMFRQHLQCPRKNFPPVFTINRGMLQNNRTCITRNFTPGGFQIKIFISSLLTSVAGESTHRRVIIRRAIMFSAAVISCVFWYVKMLLSAYIMIRLFLTFLSGAPYIVIDWFDNICYSVLCIDNDTQASTTSTGSRKIAT